MLVLCGLQPRPYEGLAALQAHDRSFLRVVAVLLAAARIATDGLEMRIRVGADPHVRPSRGDGEPLDPLEDGRIAQQCAVVTRIPGPTHTTGSPIDWVGIRAVAQLEGRTLARG
jgi:hypothetical protein